MLTMNQMDDKEMEAVNGGSEIKDNPKMKQNLKAESGSGAKTKWCYKCKKFVEYQEFSGGRLHCPFCNDPV